MRGQGLDWGSEEGVTSPLAAADVAAQLAFIANKLPIKRRRSPRGPPAAFARRIPPQRGPVVFAVQRTLRSAKSTFV